MDWLTDYLTFAADVSRTESEGNKVYIALAAIVLALIWPTQKRLQLGQAMAFAVIGGIFAATQMGYEIVHLGFLLGLGGIVLVWPALAAAKGELARLLLVVLTLVSISNYLRWGPKLAVDRVDTYDLMHYYLNAKYFDELGYYDLYPACILADVENDGPRWDKKGNIYMAQDEKGHALKPLSHAVERGRVVRSNNFTPARWKEFESDFLYLHRQVYGMSDSMWRQMIQDHGFNGTPVWTLIARPFAEAIPANQMGRFMGRDVPVIKLVGLLDVALLAIAFALVGWAYGSETALWAMLWLTLSYSLRWPTVSWVFLRYDWVAALMLSMVALKKKRPYIAGLLTAWSATLRLFPAFWMWGPFAKGVSGLARKHVHKQLLVMALGFFVGVGVLEAGAIGRFGMDQVVVHIENMSDHNKAEQLSSRRIGLALGLAFAGPFEKQPLPTIIGPERKKRIGEQKALRYGLGIAMMVIMGWALRRSDDDEAFGYGFIPIFLLTTMSYYYYIARVTLAILHAADLSKVRNQVGLAMLLGMELFCNWAEFTYKEHRLFLIGYLAWFIAAYAIVMCAFLLVDAHQQDRADGDGQFLRSAPPEMLGGVLMVGIAVVWFLAGLVAGVVFVYPIVLVVLGIIALVRGATTREA
ncbi:MAG: hypothetical protein H6734_07395 [Alphaproteobacteria bacterium]|nr:hypothetical protein [Alphaproteobacteria bacterium]